MRTSSFFLAALCTLAACGGHANRNHDLGGGGATGGDGDLGDTPLSDGGAAYDLAPPPQPPAFTYGIAALTAFADLPFIRWNERSGHQSSYDRSGGNNDFNNFLYAEASGDEVLLDLEGPGCVYRTWFTGFQAPDKINVYLDGETAPSISMPLADFFSGTKAPFLAPLVANDQISSGGFFSYVPIAFAKSIRITASVSKKNGFYYNFDYRLYAPGTPIATFNGAVDAAAASALWKNAGSDPKPDPGHDTTSGTATLAAGAAATLLDLDGPRQIVAILLKPSAMPAAELLNGVHLTAAWDGEAAPSVDVPLGAFFAMGQFGAQPSHGLGAGLRADGTLYVYFPMPFRKHATIALVNKANAALPATGFEIRHRAFNQWVSNIGYFKTQYHAALPTTTGVDVVFLDTTGSGQVVAVLQSETGPTGFGFLEGDERAVIDGNRSPSIHGTGTEDFYNGGWYFNRGTFTLPTHGDLYKVDDGKTAASIAMYREFISDTIPFRSKIRLSIEHADTDYANFNTNVWSMAFYYASATTPMTLSDELAVGDAASESAHQYAITNATINVTRSYTFEGETDRASVALSGRAHKGTSEFTMKLAAGNHGAVLRRTFDQGIANQRANVYVDDVLVGVFYKAGGNGTHNWREEEFVIPASFTSGKQQIRIRIKFVASDMDWNEFHYQLFSITD